MMEQHAQYADMLIEPTPLSDIIHNQHLYNQRLQAHYQLYDDEIYDEFGLVIKASCQRIRGPSMRVSFAADAIAHRNPRSFQEMHLSWYSVGYLLVAYCVERRLFLSLDLCVIVSNIFPLFFVTMIMICRGTNLRYSNRNERRLYER
jgi:hypothetical protein